jgi:hypothetical protein
VKEYNSIYPLSKLTMLSFEGDILFNVSGILDMNNVIRAAEIVSLEALAHAVET